MRVLAIESSGMDGSVALVNDDNVVFGKSFTNPRGRGSGLFMTLTEIVKPEANFDLVLVGTGPGSYNGLRSSIAAAWGIAHARKARLAGVCSLLGYAAPDYYVAGDARAGQWFFARVTGGRLVKEVELLPPEKILQGLDPSIPIFSTSSLQGLEQATVQCPRAEILARHYAIAGAPEPIYLKPPHITAPRR